MGKALKFASTYGIVGVEQFDTLEEAISDAVTQSDAGNEALVHIEFDGQIYDGDSPEYVAEERRRRDAWASARRDEPKPTHWIEVATSDGKRWAHAETVTGDEPEKVAAWTALVGADRVRLKRIPGNP